MTSSPTLVTRIAEDTGGTLIPVPISYEIIRLFSEGLYQSPHKAIEELVSNSFDAGAEHVSVVVPTPVEGDQPQGSLWVIDDGCGMDDQGFRQLWRVAESRKENLEEENGRRQIGQFGIGKLAAFVLAWHLTHVSKSSDGLFRYTSMNFREVIGHRLNAQDPVPIQVHLHQISEARAKTLLSEVETEDPATWDRLFGPRATETWTAAALSDFKDLFGKLRQGMLGWVLRTGLPLVSNFEIRLNGGPLDPAQPRSKPIFEHTVGGQSDAAATAVGLAWTSEGIEIPGIEGIISGKARIFQTTLTTGKSDQYGRSHGFFVRVRGRVINLEDELFGLAAENHSAWARFTMEIEADGLREHLLSSREGVRDSEPIGKLREYLHQSFNSCRNAYEQHLRETLIGLELDSLLGEPPSPFILDPLLDAIRAQVVEEANTQYYMKIPDVEEPEAWLDETDKGLRTSIFADFRVVDGEPENHLCEYDPSTRLVTLNRRHPYAESVLEHSKNNRPAEMVVISEVFKEVLLRGSGIPGYSVHRILEQHDRILRRLVGEQPIDVPTVLRQLAVANADSTAMERAVGHAFEVLGLDYEPRGGNQGGNDGVLRARLGRGAGRERSFTVVFDAKTTDGSAVPADKVDLQKMKVFREDEEAEYALVVGKKFAAEDDPEGSLNRKIVSAAGQGNRVTVLRTADLVDLVRTHHEFGVTFDELRRLFESAQTPTEAGEWVAELRAGLADADPLPLRTLLDALEREQQADPKAQPNVRAARSKNNDLLRHPPERLISALRAASTLVGDRMVSVEASSGDVRMGQSAAEIAREFERRLAEIEGVQAQIHHKAP